MNARRRHGCAPEDLYRLARRRFIQAQRLELQPLAEELGISRATAYRWAGNAERLAGRVLSAVFEDSFEHARRRTRRHASGGAARVADVVAGLVRDGHRFPPLRAFLLHDSQAALRVLASDRGPLRPRAVRRFRGLMEDETAAGRLSRAQPGTADAVTRVFESYLYLDLATGAEPDPAGAARSVRILIGG